MTIDAQAIGLPTRGATIDAATLEAPAELKVAERGADPGRGDHARDAALLQAARPHRAGRSLRTADPVPGEPADAVERPARAVRRRRLQRRADHRPDVAAGLALRHRSPLAQGFVTVGTDSGHQTAQGQPPQAFALNDEALVNFAHASYKKVRDVAVELTKRRYGRAPGKLYFVGSSEGGREA